MLFNIMPKLLVERGQISRTRRSHASIQVRLQETLSQPSSSDDGKSLVDGSLTHVMNTRRSAWNNFAMPSPFIVAIQL
jgi:hypothetical protein